jgi:hypothetical protein
MIPSGYKDQKVYSVKPLDGSGDLTFSRASAATRVASNGLIEKVRTNLALSSNNISTQSTYWGDNQNGVTTQNSATAPDGTTTAALITPDGVSTYSGVRQSQTFSAVPTTYSVYLKTNSGTASVNLIAIDSAATFFGLTPVTVTTTWTRFTLTFTPAAGAGNIYITSSGSAAWLAWGAQLETGDIATDLIATTSAAVSVGPVSGLPRLDYLNSTCPRLLLEPQRTNLAIYSEQFNNAAWSKDPLGGTALTTVVTANQATSPDGYVDADKVFMSLGGGTTTSDWARLQSASFSQTSGTAYTISFYAWASQSSEVGKKVRVGVGGNTALLDFTLTATATRFTVTYTAASTGTDSLLFQIRGNQGLASTAEFFLWGCQLEAGAYATSYIPTLGTSVTRVTDAALTGSVPSLIGQTEGTLFVEITRTNVQEPFFIILSNSAGTTANSYLNSIYLFQLPNGNFVSDGFVSGTAQYNFSVSGLSLTRHKIALAYKQNDFALYIDGVQIATDTSGNIPAMNYLTIHGGADVSNQSNKLSQALLFKTRLTNAQLAELTTL